MQDYILDAKLRLMTIVAWSASFKENIKFKHYEYEFFRFKNFSAQSNKQMKEVSDRWWNLDQ